MRALQRNTLNCLEVCGIYSGCWDSSAEREIWLTTMPMSSVQQKIGRLSILTFSSVIGRSKSSKKLLNLNLVILEINFA